jgi:hypothetical protein
MICTMNGTRVTLTGAVCAALLALSGVAQGASVTLLARVGEKAIFLVGGERHVMAVGDSAAGIRLVAMDGGSVLIETEGR